MSLVNSGDQLSAFPWVCEDQKIVAKGMALRDYFSAQAMQGMLAGYQGNPPEPEKVAEDAYAIADAMLKVRDSDGQT